MYWYEMRNHSEDKDHPGSWINLRKVLDQQYTNPKERQAVVAEIHKFEEEQRFRYIRHAWRETLIRFGVLDRVHREWVKCNPKTRQQIHECVLKHAPFARISTEPNFRTDYFQTKPFGIVHEHLKAWQMAEAEFSMHLDEAWAERRQEGVQIAMAEFKERVVMPEVRALEEMVNKTLPHYIHARNFINKDPIVLRRDSYHINSNANISNKESSSEEDEETRRKRNSQLRELRELSQQLLDAHTIFHQKQQEALQQLPVNVESAIHS